MADSLVNTPNAAYNDMAAHWALPDTLMGGTMAMQAAETTYLPKFASESETGYEARRKASVLYNAYGRTVGILAGEPLKSPPILVEPSPQDEVIEHDADLQGADLTAYTHRILLDLVNKGKHHTLVAYQDTDAIRESTGRSTVTRMDEIAFDVRPYFVRLESANVIGWRGTRVAGREMLTQVRVRELDTEPDGEFGERVVTYVRVYTMDEVVRYREPEKGSREWVEVDRRANDLGYIPIVTVYAKRLGLLKAYPPLEDLAWLNLQHWQASSDQFNILHFARIYMMAMYGWDEDDVKTIDVGVAAAIIQSNTDARIDIVEHSGAAISAGRVQLQDLCELMRSLGTDMLVPKANPTATATEAQIDKAEMVSELQLIVRNAERGLVQMFEIAADWQERKLLPGFRVDIQQSYSTNLFGSTQPKDIRDLYGLGMLDKRTTLQEHQRIGVISDEIDIDEVLASAQLESDLPGSFEEEPEEEDLPSAGEEGDSEEEA